MGEAGGGGILRGYLLSLLFKVGRGGVYCEVAFYLFYLECCFTRERGGRVVILHGTRDALHSCSLSCVALFYRGREGGRVVLVS